MLNIKFYSRIIFHITFALISVVTLAGNGTISFFVRDNITYMGISASITAEGDSANNGQAHSIMQTASSGHSVFSTLSGVYHFKIQAAGYKTLETHFSIEEGKDLQADIILDRINYTNNLPHNPLVSGYVIDRTTGKPLSGVMVKIQCLNKNCVTDKNGYFIFDVKDAVKKVKDNIIRTDIVFHKKDYTTYIYNNAMLCDDAVRLNIDLKPGKGVKVFHCVIGAIDQQPNEQKQQQRDGVNGPYKEGPFTSPQSSCTVPSSIRVGLDCSCTTCSSVSTMSLETYVGTGIWNEWVNAWGSMSGGMNALEAGCVAYRSYGAYYVNNPVNANYDIASSTCNQVYSNASYTNSIGAAANTVGYVITNSSNVIIESQYAAEQTGYCSPCTDGCAGNGSSTYPCISDGVCSGQTSNGNGYGMCQYGSARWATGITVSPSSLTSGPSTGQATLTWQEIIAHYYENFSLNSCQSGSACSPPPAPVLSSPGTATCGSEPPQLNADVINYFYSSSITGSVCYDFQISQYPYGGSCCEGCNLVQYADGVPAANSVNVPAGSLQAGMLYRWNVIGYSDCENTSCEAVSNTYYFQVPPVISTNDLTTICQGGSVYLTTDDIIVNSPGSVTYTWYNNGTQVYNGPNYFYYATSSGNYTVAVNYSGSCYCSASTSPSSGITVTVLSPPSTPSISPTSGCSPLSVTATSSGCNGCSYNWSTPNGSNSGSPIQATTSGTYVVTVTNSSGCTASNSAYITIVSTPAEPSSILGDNAPCLGNQTYSVTDIAGVTYTWSVSGGGSVTSGQNTNQAVIDWTSAGTYTVSVTPSNSCGSGTTASTVVTVSILPSTPIITGGATICAEGMAILQIQNWVNGCHYLWSTGDTTAAITESPGSSTTYTVTARNSCGTSAPGSAIVTVNEIPAMPVVTGATTICSGGSDTMKIQDPCQGCSYQWSTNQSGTSISVSPENTTPYSVTATNSCGTSTPASATVTVTSSPTVIISASGPTSFCQGGSVTLTASPTGSGYKWNNGNSNSSISVNTSGSYSVTVTNAGGCTGTFSSRTPTSVIVYPNPTADAGISQSITNGKTDTLGSNPTASGGSGSYTYNWNPPTGLNSTSAANPTVNGITATTTYTVTVTDANGCSATSSVTVGYNTILCTYSISPTESTLLPDAGGTDSFNVNVVNGTNCSWSIDSCGSWVHITSPSFPYIGSTQVIYMVDSNPDSASRSCSLMLDGQSYSITQEGKGNVAPGCGPFYDTLYPGNILAVEPIVQGATYVWYLNAAPLTGDTLRVLTSAQPGLYNTVVTCQDGQKYTTPDFDVTTGINVLNVINSFDIFPNPNNGLFTLDYELASASVIEVKIYDASGQIIYHQVPTLQTCHVSEQIDLGAQAKGIYLVLLKSADSVITKRIVVQ